MLNSLFSHIKVKRHDLCSACFGLTLHFQDHRRPRMAAVAPAIVNAFLLAGVKKERRVQHAVFPQGHCFTTFLCVYGIPVCGRAWNRSQISRLLFQAFPNSLSARLGIFIRFFFFLRKTLKFLCFSHSLVFVSRRWFFSWIPGKVVVSVQPVGTFIR